LPVSFPVQIIYRIVSTIGWSSLAACESVNACVSVCAFPYLHE